MRTWRPADMNILEVVDDCGVWLAQKVLRCVPQVCAGTGVAGLSQTLTQGSAPRDRAICLMVAIRVMRA